MNLDLLLQQILGDAFYLELGAVGVHLLAFIVSLLILLATLRDKPAKNVVTSKDDQELLSISQVSKSTGPNILRYIRFSCLVILFTNFNSIEYLRWINDRGSKQMILFEHSLFFFSTDWFLSKNTGHQFFFCLVFKPQQRVSLFFFFNSYKLSFFVCFYLFTFFFCRNFYKQFIYRTLEVDPPLLYHQTTGTTLSQSTPHYIKHHSNTYRSPAASMPELPSRIYRCGSETRV